MAWLYDDVSNVLVNLDHVNAIELGGSGDEMRSLWAVTSNGRKVDLRSTHTSGLREAEAVLADLALRLGAEAVVRPERGR